MRTKWDLAGWASVGLIGGLCLSQLIAYVQVSRDFSIDEKTCRSQEEARAAAEWAARENKKPTDDDKQAEQKKAAREYCAQRRSTIAAENQAEFARRSLHLSIATFIAAVGAALAAGFAAKFANDTVATMRKTAQLENRAWLKIEDVEMTGNFIVNKEGAKTIISVKLKNLGLSPASAVLVTGKLTVVGGRQQTLPVDIEALRSETSNGYRERGRFTMFPDDVLAFTNVPVSCTYEQIAGVEDGVVAVPLIIVSVAYGTIGGETAGETGRIYLVQHVDVKVTRTRDSRPLERTKASHEWTA